MNHIEICMEPLRTYRYLEMYNYKQRENIWFAQADNKTISLYFAGLLHKFLKVERLFIMGYYMRARLCVGHSPERKQKQFNMTGIR